MTKERKTRSDKKIRVNSGLSYSLHEKLEMLALACGVSKTKMAEKIIEMALGSVDSVENIQKNLGVRNIYRIRATEINGQVLFRHENSHLK